MNWTQPLVNLRQRIGTPARRDTQTESPGDSVPDEVAESGLIPLADAHRRGDGVGLKAVRLAQLIEADVDVAPGFVICADLARRLADGSLEVDEHTDPAYLQPLLDKAGNTELDELWASLGSERAVVRRSGSREGNAGAHFSDAPTAVLPIDRSALSAAARTVYDSLDSTCPDAGGVIVQAMLDTEYTGALFTRHPGTSGAMLVELTLDAFDATEGGNDLIDRFRFGKLTGALQAEDGDDPAPLPPMDLQPLLTLGREVEALFGAPQLIQWAYVGGHFHVLQASDITDPITAGDALLARAERERARLLAELAGRRRHPRVRPGDASDTPLLVRNEHCDALPRPTTLSADLMGSVCAANGATDIACQQLDVPYDVHARSVPLITTLFGWSYVNQVEEARRIGKGPGSMTGFRLSRDAPAMQASFEREFLPAFRDRTVERNAIAFDRLHLETATSLLERWLDGFIRDTWVQAERLRIAAGFHDANARDKLLAASLDPARYLGPGTDSIVAHAILMVAERPTDQRALEEFLMVFGHRAPEDFELSMPRFDEDESQIADYVQRSASLLGAPAEGDVAPPSLEEDPDLADRGALRVAVQRARTFRTLEQDARHYCLIELAQIRELLLNIDRLAGLGGRIFDLRLREACQVHDPLYLAELIERADARRADEQAWATLLPPASLSLNALERIDLLSNRMPGQRRATEMAGARVAGAEPVTGTARVLTDTSGIDTFRQGEILIARTADPAWYPLFERAAGIVTETGGWLDEAAIAAREIDLPTIAGVPDACRRIATGDIVTLAVDGSVTLLSGDAQPMSDTAVAQPSSEDRRHFTTPAQRRALKATHQDRRLLPRFDEAGEPVMQRRKVARTANLAAYRRSA